MRTRPWLEQLEERTLLDKGIANAVVLSISDSGRFVLYAPVALFTGQNGPPQTVPLILRDQQNQNAPVDQQLSGSIPDPLIPGNAVPSISHDGNFVVYLSPASPRNNLQVFLVQVNQQNITQSGPAYLVSHTAGNSTRGSDAAAASPVVASNTSSVAAVAFSSTASDLSGENGNPSGFANVFLSTVTFGSSVSDSTVLVSQAAGMSGTVADNDSANPAVSLSNNGTFVAFQSLADNLVSGGSISGSNVYLFDASAGVSLVSHAAGSTTTSPGGDSVSPVISQDGSSVAYVSMGTQVVANQNGPANVNNVFLYNRSATSNALVSGHLGSASTTGNGNSDSPAIDMDGTFVAYRSDATDLVANVTDDNNQSDVFAYSLGTQKSALVSSSAARPGHTANGPSGTPVIAPAGNFVAYTSNATDLVANASATGNLNVYRWFRPQAVNFLISGLIDSTTGRQSVTTAQNTSQGSIASVTSLPPVIDQNGNVLFTLTTFMGSGGSGYATATVTVGSTDVVINLALNPTTIPNGTPPGTIATLSTSVLIGGLPAVGQVALPTYSILIGASAFALSGPADPNTGNTGLNSLFTANVAVQSTYTIRLQTDPHISAPVDGDFTITVMPTSTPPPTGTSPVGSATSGEFDPSMGIWYLPSGNGAGALVDSFAYGAPGWRPIAGDWKGATDGAGHMVDTVGVFDPTTATFHLAGVNLAGTGDAVPAFAFGFGAWIPLAGDWNNDGVDSIGAFDPATATWYLRNENSSGPADAGTFQFGLPGWIPIVGKWNGKTTGIGAVDPTTNTFYLRSTPSSGSADVGIFPFGLVGWKPVTGDFGNTGTTGIGVVDPAFFATWYLRFTPTSGAADVTAFAFGLGSWTPVGGRFFGLPGGTQPLSAVGMDTLVVTALLRKEQDAVFSQGF
jgi:hypothetical protein